MNRRKHGFGTCLSVGGLSVLAILYVVPILLIFINSFKSKTWITKTPFLPPNASTWVGLENYQRGLDYYKFLSGLGSSLMITVGSVLAILLLCSMFAWYITRVQNKWTKLLYLLCVFSMVVPFQMVMFTLAKVSDTLKLNTPWGIIIVYLGFGTGLAVFMFSGFVKGIPLEIEESAMIDGASPVRTFFHIDVAIMIPTFISVGILQTMWIWNDFLLPYLVLDLKKYKTIPIIIQSMKGSYGRVDMGAIMACLVMAVIPVIVFFIAAQKYIIEGVAAGAVKG